MPQECHRGPVFCNSILVAPCTSYLGQIHQPSESIHSVLCYSVVTYIDTDMVLKMWLKGPVMLRDLCDHKMRMISILQPLASQNNSTSHDVKYAKYKNKALTTSPNI